MKNKENRLFFHCKKAKGPSQRSQRSPPDWAPLRGGLGWENQAFFNFKLWRFMMGVTIGIAVTVFAISGNFWTSCVLCMPGSKASFDCRAYLWKMSDFHQKLRNEILNKSMFFTINPYFWAWILFNLDARSIFISMTTEKWYEKVDFMKKTNFCLFLLYKARKPLSPFASRFLFSKAHWKGRWTLDEPFRRQDPRGAHGPSAQSTGASKT